MVVTGIFVILTGVVLANNSRFGNVIVLQNLAHDIALGIRQAQVYGIAVRGCTPTVANPNLCDAVASDQFNLAYGVHFTQATSVFELFADTSRNGLYTPGETLLSTTIGGGYRISLMCVILTTAGESGTCTAVSELNVVFLRPEPDACINGVISGNVCTSAYRQARIVVSSNRGDTAEVIIESTGQISAQ